jgi:hypothetical protein
MIPFVGYDIETKPREDLVKRFTRPFPAFDSSSVKYGNTKDASKRADFLALKQEEHGTAESAYWDQAHEKAALNPYTGEIIVVGIVNEEGAISYLEGDESSILGEFWALFMAHGDAALRFVNWSGSGNPYKSFDLDFIVTRSRIRGVRVPQVARNGRYYSSRFVDLATEFLLADQAAYLSLSRAADLLGLYGEAGGRLRPKDKEKDEVTGENFHKFYAADRVKAMPYLDNDLLHLHAIATRIL